MKKRFICFILGILVVTVITLIGCETTKGVGRDVQKAGQSIERTAERND